MTKKKANAQEQASAQALRDRLILTIKFFEDAQDFPSGAQMRTIVEEAAGRDDVRTLRLIGREIDAMMIALAPHERDGLEAILYDRLGVDKDIECATLKRQIADVLARGKLASEKERRRIEDYLCTLEATGGDPVEIAAVRHLLITG